MAKCEHEHEVAQSCPTLCDPMDCSLPGSSVHGIFQAIVLEWIAISYIEKWNAKAIVKGCRETGKELLSNCMVNGTAYLSHISDLPSKVFWVQGENNHKHLFFSMTSSIGLIVTRSQKPSSCLSVCVCMCESLRSPPVV